MEGDSCSSICFDAVNVKNEPEDGFNEQVHVKEEEDHIKEEPEWEDHAGLHGISAAAARAGLYANHEVKDELVLGPEGVQPADLAFTLYACQASAAGAQPVLRDCVRQVADNADVGNQLHSNANIHTEKEIYICDICTKRFALKTQLMKHVVTHMHQITEQEEICVADNAAQALAVKEQHELRDCVARLERIEDPAPLSIQQPHSRHGAGQEGNGLSARARGRHRDHTYARTECPPAARGGRGEGREPTRAQDWRHACLICRKDFPKPSLLKRHELIHTGERPFSCGICKQKFTQSSNLKRHERTHTGERPLSCGIYKQKFTKLACQASAAGAQPVLRDCVRQVADNADVGNQLHSNANIHTEKEIYICDICTKRFVLKTQLMEHVVNHMHQITEQEEICVAENGLSARARGRHRNHTYARTECPPAARGGRGEGREPTRAQDWRHACLICRREYRVPSDLKRHELTHTRERPFSCGICNKKFTQLGSLKSHERTHTGERPFSCGICNKNFTESGSLKKHEITHTGERPFSCGICNKKFTRLGHVKRHELIHTGKWRFSCGICNKKFTRLDHLKIHERTHTGKRSLSCGICNQKFTTLGSLKSHELIHSQT